ncbi:glycosyltransferase family 2 protein [Nonomuraea roseoviolacea]|uniref:Glycosyltransferase n=1 Tax=Nonomuraea roseoviolacea subsp. carminata TaxID=160689 RepID=A0ABT1JRZ9_9ACTN|nr:hypothetical protein [Nonomuraea roseoviolacea]MCP2344122.1 hypothetical protein [Nonomuraea roseoviolacea subsp. carminata]
MTPAPGSRGGAAGDPRVAHSADDARAQAVTATYPDVDVVALCENLGAVGRDIGARRLDTPYVAFADDDT